jgi:hypothetical protein
MGKPEMPLTALQRVRTEPHAKDRGSQMGFSISLKVQRKKQT